VYFKTSEPVTSFPGGFDSRALPPYNFWGSRRPLFEQKPEETPPLACRASYEENNRSGVHVAPSSSKSSPSRLPCKLWRQ